MDILKTAFDFLKESKNKGETETVLTRLFLLECHHNRKIVAMMNWKNSTPEMIRMLAGEFKTDAARAVIGFVNRGAIDYLFSAVLDREDEEMHNSRLISLITKIEAVQVIARLDPKGQLKHNKFKQRIDNLERLLNDIIQNVGDK
jgi:hypothetical protein